MKTKQRAVPDLTNTGLDKSQFKEYWFVKGFPADKKFALILVKTDGMVDVFTGNSNIKTAENELRKWEKGYGYKHEVVRWQIIPLVTITI